MRAGDRLAILPAEADATSVKGTVKRRGDDAD